MDDEDRYTRITLRIPKDLHRTLSEAADKTSKSLNAEIVGRLAASLDQKGAEATAAQIEASARAIGYQPGTDEFAGAVDALKGELRSLLTQQTEELLANIVKMDQLRRIDPEAFHRIVDLKPPTKRIRKPKP
jgi:hypothetical protein